MKFLSTSLTIFISVFSLLPAFAYAPWKHEQIDESQNNRDPLGEVAHYVLDKGARSSWMVKSGKAQATVNKFIPADPGDGENTGHGKYEIDFSFDIKITVVGRKKDNQLIEITSDYFGPAFMEQLRADRYYDGGDFKIKYIEQVDTTTMNGVFYPACDRIQLYDIKEGTNSPLVNLFRNLFMAQTEGATADSIKDLNIFAMVKPGLPVLGIVRIDLSGKVNGTKLKMGFDYQ